MTTFNKGDFITVDYSAKIKETGTIFDTTYEDVAKEARLYRENNVYEPKFIVLGEGWVLRPLEESILNTKIGKEDEIEIPPEKAFGKRNPDKLKLVPLRKLLKLDIRPKIGMEINYLGKRATIRNVGSGRVLLDFNNKLAGKTIVYNYIVRSKLRTMYQKVLAIIHRRLPLIDVNLLNIDITKSSVLIHMPEEAFYIDGIQLAKKGISVDINYFFPNIEETRILEVYKSPKKAKTLEG